MNALREDVDLRQQRAMLALVLIEVDIAVRDLDALLALEVVLGVAAQLGLQLGLELFGFLGGRAV